MRPAAAAAGRAAIAVALWIAAGPSGGGARASDPPITLEECATRARSEPDRAESWTCFQEVAERTGAYREAIRLLEPRAAIHADNPWARLTLGNLLFRTGEPERAMKTAGRAAEEFAAARDPEGEVVARIRLGYMEGRTGGIAEAERQFALAMDAATAAGRQDLIGRVEIDLGYTALITGDYTRASLVLGRAAGREGALPPGARLRLAGARAEMALRTFEYGPALGLYRKVVALARGQQDPFMELVGLEGLMSVGEALARSGEMDRGELAATARETLAAAERAGAVDKICSSLVALADAVGGDEAVTVLRRAVATARASRDRRTVNYVLGAAGYLLAGASREADREARALLEEARTAAREHGGIWEMRLAQEYVAMAARRLEPRDRAVEEFERLFERIEQVRDLQRDEEIRARTFAEDAYAYRAFTGWLLGDGGEGASREDVELAFRTMERMRARVLLDALDASGATAALAPSGPLAERRAAALDGIVRVQASLADPRLPREERDRLLSELESLELEEAEAREAMAAEDPTYAALRRPDLAGIEDVQAALLEGEALLAYQVSSREFGGSWLFVVTARDVRVLPLPDAARIRRAARFFLGLLDARDGSEGEAAETLGRDLLDPALGDLDPEVRRLIILPDDFLWRIPFDALRAGGPDGPVGERYETFVAPSASLLLRWRASPPPPARTPALSLADPSLPAPAAGAGAAAERQWALAEGARLGRLPRARDEARGLVETLGRDSLLLVGAQASESYLKATRLSEYAIVHLAAHALVDDANPARSAVILAPGGPKEDGLLQAREIIGLALAGRVVLLSACRGASGEILSGEGPMSLARAFFQAGAHAVVGGLRPLRDDEAAALVASFSRHLAAGESLSAALAGARRERIRSGAPAAAWSSLVVLGDGALRPLPGRPVPPAAAGRMVAALLALATLAIAAALLPAVLRRLRANSP